jgi:hypothetical protein
MLQTVIDQTRAIRQLMVLKEIMQKGATPVDKFDRRVAIRTTKRH